MGGQGGVGRVWAGTASVLPLFRWLLLFTQPYPPAPALDRTDLRARLGWAGFLILPPTPGGLGQVPTPLCVRGPEFPHQEKKKEK